VTEVLGAEALSKSYRDGERTIDAVKNATLSIPKGTFAVLAGPSGSGKTTLLALLGGLVAPTSGAARVAGTDVATLREHHRTRWRRTHVGFVAQAFALIPEMSLLENVLLPLVPLGGATRSGLERASALFERFGISALADRRVSTLSAGERQRGALVRALITDAAALLLDEPTAHLDEENAAALLDALVSLRDEGRAIVVATHDPRVIDDSRVDRRMRMEQGFLA
jgi:putative ABC transport system ATP-binding protein